VSKDKYQRLLERFPSLPAYEQGDGSYKLPAAWLIDQAGWKGRRVGAVGMHERQALVMVNYGGADAGQVACLAQAIQEDVQRRYGVVLEQEPVGVSWGWFLLLGGTVSCGPGLPLSSGLAVGRCPTSRFL